jgi:hypothetical protein
MEQKTTQLTPPTLSNHSGRLRAPVAREAPASHRMEPADVKEKKQLNATGCNSGTDAWGHRASSAILPSRKKVLKQSRPLLRAAECLPLEEPEVCLLFGAGLGVLEGTQHHTPAAAPKAPVPGV